MSETKCDCTAYTNLATDADARIRSLEYALETAKTQLGRVIDDWENAQNRINVCEDMCRLLGAEVAEWRKRCGSRDDRTWRIHYTDYESERITCERFDQANAVDAHPEASKYVKETT